MLALQNVTPTPEQLKLIQNPRPGVSVIRGAAGSGKTTTALLRLRFLATFRHNRQMRLAAQGATAAPVNVLVLTFNRTLRGYIDALARQHLAARLSTTIRVSTFAQWAYSVVGGPNILDNNERARALASFSVGFPLTHEFLCDEVDYLLGRYRPEGRHLYLKQRREGRGATPRVDGALRKRLLDEVVTPYEAWKSAQGVIDWNDLAIAATDAAVATAYDVVIVDEAQDFCANQARAVMRHAAAQHAVTFVLDAAQRIYPRFFTWAEAGITITPGESHRLGRNYRNTAEIAALARSVIADMELDDDGTLPDLTSCTRHGDRPIAFLGKYSAQVTAAIAHVRRKANLTTETVAFVHPKGWFDHLRAELANAGLPFVEITQKSEWPAGTENIALSTIHSAKGLEFDHVIALGLNAETTPHGEEDGDSQLESLRRLLAMGIGRARKTVVLGYKPTEQSSLIKFLDPKAIDLVHL